MEKFDKENISHSRVRREILLRRVGGATDLFVCRISYCIKKKMGRSKSEAAIYYYRCDEDVKKVVAAAFTKYFCS